ETTQLYEDVKENHVTELIIYKPLLGIFPEQVPAPSNDLSYPGGDLSPTSDLIPLIGRSQELEQLKRIYEGMRQNGFLTVLTGEAGIGKTRLAHEFLSQLQSRGTAILSTQCYAGESNLTFSPLIDLLRQGIKLSSERKWWQGVNPHLLSEVSRLLPEFSEIIPDLPNSQLIDGPGAQSRFYEGVCQTLEAMVAGPSPGVLFIDNLEWADESSVDLLAYLTRRLKGRPLFLLVSWGSEPSPATTILEHMLNDAVLQGSGIRLNLSALSPVQAQELIERVVNNDEQLSSVLINRLVEESDGLPIFLVEYLHAIQSGKISIDLGEEPWPVPSGLRSMLRSRLSSLSDTA
ncbi:MAG: AAA family ATPase, partial [Chloroflexota bacterium]